MNESNSIAIGYKSKSTGSNSIAIGSHTHSYGHTWKYEKTSDELMGEKLILRKNKIDNYLKDGELNKD